jgi:PAS domain S-box-containing protein
MPLGLSPDGLSLVFPFHFVFGRDLVVRQAGRSALRLLPNLVGRVLGESLVVSRPVIPATFEAIRAAAKELFVLRARDRDLVLRGQFLAEDEAGVLCFLGSPWISSPDGLRKAGLGVRDFGIQDATIDLLYVVQSQQDALADAKRFALLLAERRAELVETNRRLEERNASLQAAEALTRGILESSPDPFISVDVAGTVSAFNRAAEEAFGWTAEEVLGRNVSMLMPEPDRSHHDGYLARYLGTGERRVIGSRREVLALRRDGTTFPCELSVGEVRAETGTVFTGFLRDFSEREAAEAALRASELLYRSVVEAVREVVFQSDAEGRLTLLNRSWTDLTGLGVGDSIGTRLEGYLHPEDREAGSRLIERLLSGEKETCRLELRFRTRDGGYRWVEAFARAMFEPGRGDGPASGTVGTLFDVTERRLIAEDLRRAKETAEDAASLKSEFLANMSHEIRTPLNAVIGMADLLCDGSLADMEREYAETIRRSGRALLELVNEVLDFSKIESGKLEILRSPFGLVECLEDTVDLVAPAAAEKGLELVLDVNVEPEASFHGDEPRIRQVLANLLSNAVKFTSVGEVVLRASRRQEGERNALVLAVEDTGIGVPRARADRLFQVFSQIDSSASRRFGGTGLGLAISRRLAEAMGGTLTFESEEGRGSTFTLTLPSGEGPPEAAGSFRRPALPRCRRVLLVEDNRSQALALRRVLTSLGLAVDHVSSGGAALDRLAGGERWDALLLDTTLPGFSAAKLVQEARALLGGASPPVVLLAPVGDRTGAVVSPGRIVRVTKPVRTRTIANALETATGGSGESGAAAPGGRGPLLLAERFPLRLLVVEDNAVNRRVVSLLLASLGYEADMAQDGLEALRALEREAYDAVLLDIQMPAVDGLEVTRRLRARQGPHPQPYVVAMTAGAFREERERCLAAGMNAFLAKPVLRVDLEQVLARAFIAQAKAPASRPGPCLEGWEADIAAALESQAAQLEGAGGIEYVAGTVEVFLSETREGLASLADALGEGDERAVEIVAHGLKGSSLTLGAARLAEAFQALEASVRGGEPTGSRGSLLAAARNEFGRTGAFLESGRWKTAAKDPKGRPSGDRGDGAGRPREGEAGT